MRCLDGRQRLMGGILRMGKVRVDQDPGCAFIIVQMEQRSVNQRQKQHAQRSPCSDTSHAGILVKAANEVNRSVERALLQRTPVLIIRSQIIEWA